MMLFSQESFWNLSLCVVSCSLYGRLSFLVCTAWQTPKISPWRQILYEKCVEKSISPVSNIAHVSHAQLTSPRFCIVVKSFLCYSDKWIRALVTREFRENWPKCMPGCFPIVSTIWFEYKITPLRIMWKSGKSLRVGPMWKTQNLIQREFASYIWIWAVNAKIFHNFHKNRWKSGMTKAWLHHWTRNFSSSFEWSKF